jgi:hypothetical protein
VSELITASAIFVDLHKNNCGKVFLQYKEKILDFYFLTFYSENVLYRIPLIKINNDSGLHLSYTLYSMYPYHTSMPDVIFAKEKSSRYEIVLNRQNWQAAK